MIVPRLDWELLPGEHGTPKLCLIVGIPASTYEVHQTADGHYLQRIGSHLRPIPGPQLATAPQQPPSGAAGGGAPRARHHT